VMVGSNCYASPGPGSGASCQLRGGDPALCADGDWPGTTGRPADRLRHEGQIPPRCLISIMLYDLGVPPFFLLTFVCEGFNLRQPSPKLPDEPHFQSTM
jgi:hypothetical protein